MATQKDHIGGGEPGLLGALGRRRRLVLAGCLLLAGALLWSARGITWHEDILDMLPVGDPVVADYRRLLEVFRPTETAWFDVGPADARTPAAEEDLLLAADSLASGLEAGLATDPPLFERVAYRRDPAELLASLDLLGRHREALFTADDLTRLEEKLAPEAIAATLSAWKRLLTQTPAPLLARALATDPLRLEASLATRLQDLRAGSLTVHRGRLFSADLGHVLVYAVPCCRSTDSLGARDLVAFVEAAVAAAEDKAPGVRISWLAGHRFSLENAERIKRDLGLVVTLSVLGIALLAVLTFSRPLFALLTLVPAAFGAVLAAGVTRWISPGVSAIAIGAGSMLIGVSVDYGIHILYHVDRGRSETRGAVMGIVRRLTAPLLLGAATTIAAFLALQASALPGFHQLGAFADLGIGGAAACAMLVLPLIIPPARPGRPTRAPRLDLTRLFAALFSRARGRRIALGGALLAITALAALGLPRVAFDGDYRGLNAASPAAHRDFEVLRQTFGDVMESTSVAVRAADPERALAQNEEVHAELLRLEAEGLVEDFRSLAPLLPSRATQERNRARWRAFWSDDRRAALKRDLESAAEEIGMRAGAFEPFLRSLARPAALLEIDDWRAGVLDELRRAHLAQEGGETLVLTGVRLEDRDRFPELANRLHALSTDVHVADGRFFVKHMVSVMHAEMARVGLVALLLIGLLLAVVIRRPGRILLLAAPPLLGLLWTFGLMGWLDLRLNLMNCVVTIFIVGLVIDYSIFLNAAWRAAATPDDSHLATSAGAVAVSALTTLLGVGALALASHPALRTVGVTALIGIASGWLAVLLVVPLVRRP